ncbi:MAG: AAA family ATPase, partial [Rhodobacteraceae bacterium]|nr:AAA family ATPase [Paracoccaceae bacterium]
MADKDKIAFLFIGVCGCGKSTIAEAFARAVGGEILDGDDFHPPANVEKMSAGIPLDDRDRAEWLAALRDAISASPEERLCVACSALKKSYRDVLREAAAEVRIIYLHGTRELLQQRLEARSDH